MADLCDIKSTIESAKQLAAHKAVDENVKDGMNLGIGSGSTIVYAVERLAERVKAERLKIVCVPTSFQSHQLITKHKLTLGALETTPVLDLTIDGADEVDANMTLIKGGGGCLFQEKIIAYNSKKLVIVADFMKSSHLLGLKWKKGIPIEVAPMAYVPIKQKIESLFGGECVLRMAVAKAGPCVTDNGNFILDWKNFDTNCNWKKVNLHLLEIPGIVETGLFVGMAHKAYFGMRDGTIKEQEIDPENLPKPCTKCQ